MLFRPETLRKEDRRTNVLLVEDNPGDAQLTQDAFQAVNSSVQLHVARDGAEAMGFLKRDALHAEAPRPKLILLDLNLPVMDGREVLGHVKRDEELKSIPIVVLTISDSKNDIEKCYQDRASCYIQKPIQLEGFQSLVRAINNFWLIWDRDAADVPGLGVRNAFR